MSPRIPAGWAIADPFTAQSGIIAVAAGVGVASAQKVLVARDIPTGARVWIDRIGVRIIDEAAYDQLILSFRRNGSKLHPWGAMTGEQFAQDRTLDIQQDFDAGELDLSATNISGTSESGASLDALSIRVVARFAGYLLREVRL